jgi:hypothetical protein
VTPQAGALRQSGLAGVLTIAIHDGQVVGPGNNEWLWRVSKLLYRSILVH